MAERIPVGLRYRQMIDDELEVGPFILFNPAIFTEHILLQTSPYPQSRQADTARTQRSISKQTTYNSRAPTPGWQTPTGREFPDRQAIWSTSSLREVNTFEARQSLGNSNQPLPSVFPGMNSLQGLEFDTFPPSRS